MTGEGFALIRSDREQKRIEERCSGIETRGTAKESHGGDMQRKRQVMHWKGIDLSG
jgi:hypothetical protein